VKEEWFSSLPLSSIFYFSLANVITEMHSSASSSDLLASSHHSDDIDRHHVILHDEDTPTNFLFFEWPYFSTNA